MLSPEQEEKFKAKARMICRDYLGQCICDSIVHELRMAFLAGADDGISAMSDKLREAHAERTA